MDFFGYWGMGSIWMGISVPFLRWKVFLQVHYLPHIVFHFKLLLGAKLKQAGLEEDSAWLEDHVVTNLNRDFVIRSHPSRK